ncbi:MAG: biotin/lipoyl-binding protein, partial [Rhodospirillales bacterium]|nr:biotin/lipoyl-binding protein [Rhodospirillales bacterium]
RLGLVLVPVLDILQSVQILGFLTFTVVFFMQLFPGNVLGLEFAAIFAIFTSQAWNMAFSLYQSLRTVPADLAEASVSFHLTAWQRFWRLEVPFAVPGLVWNTMMSMSGGWFFVVASEAVSVGDNTWKLPGIGSYVAMALEQRDIAAVLYAILAMLVVILLYDQLLFRPLVAWSARFRFETTASSTASDPWMLRLLRRTRLLALGGHTVGRTLSAVGGMRLSFGLPRSATRLSPGKSRAVDVLCLVVLALAVGWAVWRLTSFAATELTWADLGQALLLGLITLVRVAVLMVLASLIWVPIGVWLGLRPVWARRAQPVAQFLAAFPANLLFPPFVLFIVHFQLDPDIWLTPLMVLGTQWYILFNVVAGAAAFPGDLREAATNFRIGGLLWWLNGGRWVDTDDAYVQADVMTVSTDVSGIVTAIPVHEGEHVKQGDVLFRLDPQKFQIAVDDARAKLAQTRLSLEAMKSDYQARLRDAAAKQQQVNADQATYDRLAALVKQHAVTQQQTDDARFKLAADQQALDAATMQAKAELARLGGVPDAPVEEMPAYRQAQAEL